MKIRSLTKDEVPKKGRPRGAVAKIRAVHHLVAQLYAKGMKPPDIARYVNRTSATIRNWIDSPANQELVAQYCSAEHEQILSESEYTLGLLRRGRTLAIEQVVEQLEEAEVTGEQLPLSKLLAVAGDFADRTGVARQTVTLNINANLESRMDGLRERHLKLVEARKEGTVVKLVRRL